VRTISVIGFDHIMAGVRTFDSVERDFGALGFEVVERLDESFRPIPELLVCFSDGSCIEFQEISAENPHAPDNRYFSITRDWTGLTDYALSVTGIEAHRDAFAAAGHPAATVRQVDRQTLAGAPWGIKVAALGRSVGSPLLPILSERTAGVSVRVPPPTGGQHPNGATRVAGVVLASADPDAAAALLSQLLGDVLGARPASGPSETGAGWPGPVWEFDGRWVTIAPLDYPGVADYLGQVGDGVLEISVGTEAGPTPGPAQGELHDVQLAHGLRIRQVFDA
jgi:hypothetical protein